MRTLDQKKLDDLQEGKTVLKLDLGDTFVIGVYYGLKRIKLGNKVRWYIDVRKRSKTKCEDHLIETSDIEVLRILKNGI